MTIHDRTTRRRPTRSTVIPASFLATRSIRSRKTMRSIVQAKSTIGVDCVCWSLFVTGHYSASAETIYSTTENDLAAGWFNDNSNVKVAQSFELGNNNTVSSVGLRMYRDGNARGTSHLDIYSNRLGRPDDFIGRLGSIDDASIEHQPLGGHYRFDKPVSGLTPNDTYFLVFSREDSSQRGKQRLFLECQP